MGFVKSVKAALPCLVGLAAGFLLALHTLVLLPHHKSLDLDAARHGGSGGSVKHTPQHLVRRGRGGGASGVTHNGGAVDGGTADGVVGGGAGGWASAVSSALAEEKALLARFATDAVAADADAADASTAEANAAAEAEARAAAAEASSELSQERLAGLEARLAAAEAAAEAAAAARDRGRAEARCVMVTFLSRPRG